ncbi:prepilin-type N-terminal cleavage/methylation domain-containing protein [Candidatus Falkowbacteria bacterium]|nr:prepilin-type N-terminal cleavage/methylation domain-containing protein [Candidatus Falkowbacteria bacterium]
MIKNRLKSIRSGAGFTFIEMSVSVTIIGLLATLFVTNYRSAERQQRLYTAADQLVSDIRLMQSYALGAKKHEGQVPLGGWGVHLDATDPANYSLYADTCASGIGTYEVACATGTPDAIIKTGKLPRDVRINPVNGLMVDSVSVNDVSLLFFPPDPKTSINLTGQSLNVVLMDSMTGRTKEVDVNYFGLIDLR